MNLTLEELQRKLNNLQEEVREYRRINETLRKTQEELETRVQDRNSELLLANSRFQSEIEERKKAEAALHRRERIFAAVSAAAGRFLRSFRLKDHGIADVLEALGETTEADRVYVFENHTAPDGTCLTSQRYEWVVSTISSEKDNPNMKDFPWREGGMGRWQESLGRGDLIVGRVRDFPECEQAILSPQAIQSIAVAPIFIEEEWWGFIGFDDCRRERIWSASEVDALKTAAAMLGALVGHNQAEEMLRKTEEKYRLVVENAAEGIVVAQDGWIKFANPKVEDLWGYAAEDFASRPFLDFVHPEDRAFVRENNSRRMQNRDTTVPYLLRIIDKKGDICWLESNSVLVTWEGRPASLNFLTDITERKAAEEALKESEEKFREIADRSFDMIYTTDLEGIITYVSRAAEEIFLCSKDQMVGSHFSRFLVESEVPRATRHFKQMLDGTDAGPIELEVLRKDGSHAFIELNSSRVSRRGILIGSQGIIRDITEQKRASEALQASESELRALSMKLLHAQEEERKRIARDLHDSTCQHLAVIEMTVQDSLLALSRDAPAYKSLQPLMALLQRANDEIRRIMSNLRPAVLDDLGIGPAISSLCDELSLTPKIRVELRTAINEEEIPERIKIVIYRILQEALNNVVKHSGAGLVRISLEKKRGMIELAVEDDGAGFDPEQLRRMDLSKRGLGIASMRERAELSGGRFSLQSEAEKGTRVHTCWPCAAVLVQEESGRSDSAFV